MIYGSNTATCSPIGDPSSYVKFTDIANSELDSCSGTFKPYDYYNFSFFKGKDPNYNWIIKFSCSGGGYGDGEYKLYIASCPNPCSNGV